MTSGVVSSASGSDRTAAVGMPSGRSRASHPEAVSAAKAADVVILALGEPGGWTGENSSRSTLGLPGRQMELFDAVVATGKPVIVVLINGRPLAVPRLQEEAVAIDYRCIIKGARAAFHGLEQVCINSRPFGSFNSAV